MNYKNLRDLIRSSSSTRRYFFSLPVETQLALREHDAYIHTAQELHRCVLSLWDYERHVYLSGNYPK